MWIKSLLPPSSRGFAARHPRRFAPRFGRSSARSLAYGSFAVGRPTRSATTPQPRTAPPPPKPSLAPLTAHCVRRSRGGASLLRAARRSFALHPPEPPPQPHGSRCRTAATAQQPHRNRTTPPASAEQLGVDEPDVEHDDQRDDHAKHRRRARPIFERFHQPLLAGEPQQRDQHEREFETQRDL